MSRSPSARALSPVRPRFIDRHGALEQCRPIKLLDRVLHIFCCELNKTKPAWLARFCVRADRYARDVSELTEDCEEAVLGAGVVKISDEDAAIHK